MKYIIDTAQFEHMFTPKAIQIMGIGEDFTSGELTVWTRTCSTDELQTYEDETNEAYKRGLNDAWDFINGWFNDDVNVYGGAFGTSILSDIVENISPENAVKKLKTYKEEYKSIKVGDVVTLSGFEDDEHIVLCIRDEEDIDIFNLKNREVFNVEMKYLTKTGKSFATILDISKELAENGDEDE